MRYEEIDRRARAREYEANSRVARQAHSDARAARPDSSARTAQPWGCGGPVPPRRPPEGALRPTIGLPKSALAPRASAIQAFLGGLALVSTGITTYGTYGTSKYRRYRIHWTFLSGYSTRLSETRIVKIR